MYPNTDWAPRVLGFNTGYVLSVVPYHAVFSAALPILAVELLFPRDRNRPYLRRRGLIVTGAVFVAGIAIMRAFTAYSDPGYQVPAPQLAAVAAATGVLVALALLPPRERRTPARRPPHPAWIAAAAAAVVLLFLGLLMPLNGGATPSAALAGPARWLPLAAAIAVAAAAARPLSRWGRHPDWTGVHGSALLGGALAAHTAIGIMVFQGFGSVASVVGLIVLGVAEAVFAFWLARRGAVHRRPAARGH